MLRGIGGEPALRGSDCQNVNIALDIQSVLFLWYEIVRALDSLLKCPAAPSPARRCNYEARPSFSSRKTWVSSALSYMILGYLSCRGWYRTLRYMWLKRYNSWEGTGCQFRKKAYTCTSKSPSRYWVHWVLMSMICDTYFWDEDSHSVVHVARVTYSLVSVQLGHFLMHFKFAFYSLFSPTQTISYLK